MWRRLELVHVLNILKHLKTPLLFGKSISLHGCLLFAPVHVGVNIADDIFLECAGSAKRVLGQVGFRTSSRQMMLEHQMRNAA